MQRKNDAGLRNNGIKRKKAFFTGKSCCIRQNVVVLYSSITHTCRLYAGCPKGFADGMKRVAGLPGNYVGNKKPKEDTI